MWARRFWIFLSDRFCGFERRLALWKRRDTLLGMTNMARRRKDDSRETFP